MVVGAIGQYVFRGQGAEAQAGVPGELKHMSDFYHFHQDPKNRKQNRV